MTITQSKGIYTTYSGIIIDPLNIKVEDIKLVDIAHSTSNICRYNGHIDYFYSVAQHSVLVAQQFEPKSYLRKWALLHDASEAYLGDVPTPLKYSGNYDFYLELEQKLMNTVCDKFDLEYEEPEEVDFIDKKLRSNEMRDLRSCVPERTDYFDFEIKPWIPQKAKYEFIWEAEDLGIYL